MHSSSQALTDPTNRCASQRFIFLPRPQIVNAARSGWNHFNEMVISSSFIYGKQRAVIAAWAGIHLNSSEIFRSLINRT